MKYVLILLFIIFPLINFALIINIPDDQPTIQLGIEVAVDSDTVLVQPGTYIENINYNGKNITVGSLFLTTQDTIYISQTVIDGNQNGAVVTFENGENSYARLVGFVIINGNGKSFSFYDPYYGIYWTEYKGGGIYINVSSPSLMSLTVTNNWANSGGGIYSKNSQFSLSNSIINNNYAERQSTWYFSFGGFGGGIVNISSNSSYANVQVLNNTANYYGGGFNITNSNPQFNNVIIENNSSTNGGGGLYCNGSIIENLTILNNNAYRGGGIKVSLSSDTTIRNSIINNNSANYGGGICTYGSPSSPYHLSMENITIKDNEASEKGGGIYNVSSLCNFTSTNRSNIYNNKSPIGHDIHTNIDMEIIVDTFTVSVPTSYHIFPLENFSFLINNAYYYQVSSDLFVSPSGDDFNSGLSEDDPLRTIQKACSMILASSNNPHTINLLAGTYNRSDSGDYFPITLQNHTSLVGVNEELVILDAEEYAGVIKCYYIDDISFSNFTATNGNTTYGGGFYCIESNPTIERVTIKNNQASEGGGINCWSNSCPILNMVTIQDNYAEIRGGGVLIGSSIPHLKKVFITNNEALESGGGLFLYASSQSLLENVTIANNCSTQGGGIYSQLLCETNLINCLIWGNTPEQIYCYENYPPTILSFAYSDIMGGLDAIVTNNNATINWLEGNINSDPLLNPDYSISTNSPCFDAGTAYFEWNNEIWINLDPTEYYGSAPDMGAFEYGFVNSYQYEVDLPSNCVLCNHPNPFNLETTITFSVTQTSSFVTLSVYNIKGQKVRTLVNELLLAGEHSINWDGRDSNDRQVASGIYFYKLKVNNKNIAIKKCLLLK